LLSTPPATCRGPQQVPLGVITPPHAWHWPVEFGVEPGGHLLHRPSGHGYGFCGGHTHAFPDANCAPGQQTPADVIFVGTQHVSLGSRISPSGHGRPVGAGCTTNTQLFPDGCWPGGQHTPDAVAWPTGQQLPSGIGPWPVRQHTPIGVSWAVEQQAPSTVG
jgi:hypothetical protein